MHRVVGVIVQATTKEKAYTQGMAFLEDEVQRGSNWIDWYQGVRKSGRWDLNEFPDKPILLTSVKAKNRINGFIESAQRDFNEWYLKGSQSLEKNGLIDLETTCSYFRIASGGMSVWLFDATPYSGGGGYIRDHENLKALIDSATISTEHEQHGEKLWMCCYDTHN